MIRSTTDPCFLRWGSPVSSLGGKMVMQELKGVPLEPVTMYCPDHDTVWGYGSGMTVLLIEDGAHLHKF